MSYSFGLKSMQELQTCDDRLVLVAMEAIRYINFSVLQGHRSNEEQDRLFDRGMTQLRAGRSKHNFTPSLACDLMPYPAMLNGVNVWSDPMRWHFLAGVMHSCALRHNLTLRWGGDWDGDFSARDQQFHDLGHFELSG